MATKKKTTPTKKAAPKADTVKLRAPEFGIGIAVGNKSYRASPSGLVEVLREHAEVLVTRHGFEEIGD